MSKVSTLRFVKRPPGTKVVDRLTTKFIGEIPRFDEREQGFFRATRGDFGPEVQTFRQKGASKTSLAKALRESSVMFLPHFDGPVAEKKIEVDDPVRMSWRVKRLAKFLRSDLVGICKMEPYMYYSHTKDGKPVETNHKYGIVIVVDQNLDSFQVSSGFDELSNSQSYLSYSHSGLIAIQMAKYIRNIGYPAKAHWASRYEVLVTPMVVKSGLGEMSRMGIAVTPELGARFKAAVITTDLPLEPDKPIDFGLQEFCRVCKKCAKKCMSAAIPKGEKTVHRNYETWNLDVKKCTVFRITNHPGSSCGRCIKVCPYSNKPLTWWHKLGIWTTSKLPFTDSLMAKLDDVMGFGLKEIPEEQWYKGYNDAEYNPMDPDDGKKQ